MSSGLFNLKKMKNITALILSLLFSGMLLAQSTQKNILKVNIINPGITYETAISKYSTLNLDANVSFGYNYSNQDGSFFKGFPFWRLQYRNYYNLDKRTTSHKNTIGNSGNYVSIHSSYYYGLNSDRNYFNFLDGLTLGGTWGIQRTYKSGLNINLNTGLGYNFSPNKTKTVVPLLNFTIGWILFKN